MSPELIATISLNVAIWVTLLVVYRSLGKLEGKLGGEVLRLDQRIDTLEKHMDQRFADLLRHLDQRFSEAQRLADLRFDALEKRLDEALKAKVLTP